MDKLDYILLAALLILAVVLCKLFWSGPNLSFDDGNYVHYAQQMLNGTYNITETPYAYGIGWLSWISFSYRAFGTTPFAAALPQILSFLVLIACIYFISAYYFNERVPFFATLSIEISAFMFIYATRALPDIPIAAITALIYAIIIYKKQSLDMWLAGLIAGLSFFIKFGGAAFMAIIPIAYFLTYRNKKAALESGLMFLGLFCGIAIYAAVLPAGTGILHMFNAYSQQQVTLSEGNLANNLYTIIVMMAGYNSATPYFNQVYPLGMIFFFTIAGTWLAAKNRNKDMLFFAIIFWLGFAYLLFGTEAISHYVFITVTTRYMTLFAAPMAVLAGYLFKRIYQFVEPKTNRRTALMLLATLIIVLAMSNLPLYLYFFKNPVAHYHFVPYIHCTANTTNTGNVICD